MSESLRNDGRVWVPDGNGGRDYFLERMYPSYGNLVPRDIASRAIKNITTPTAGVYLDFADAIARLGREVIAQRYGNLFEMYERITGEDPYTVPMRIYPAIHYTMGGLWVDYDLRSTIPGLFVIGEANFSDHGANRLGASALMQGLADGYFILPNTIGDYLADGPFPPITSDTTDVSQRIDALLEVKGDRTVDSFHRELGHLMWEHCGMERTETGLRKAITLIRDLRDEFWARVNVPGSAEDLNQALERAGRVADFFELAELMCIDALHRAESCGAHFRTESQTAQGEALRDDDGFAYVAAWAFTGRKPVLHKEKLTFDQVTPSRRSYA
jgi:succinate dehydrogenase / fumarate reductase flavoprotein subunit